MSHSRFKTLDLVETNFRKNPKVWAQLETNPGLWLEKYFRGSSDEAKKKVIRDVAELASSQELYKNFYWRWKQALENKSRDSHDETTILGEAEVIGRLAIDLGRESLLETSISLLRTYGQPFIPGSAIKGLAAHYASSSLGAEWNKSSLAYSSLFGDVNSGGFVTFFDALHIPESSGNGHLRMDVITTHHQNYYGGAEEAPADWDNPIPIHFLTAGGKFLVALSGPKDWVTAAFEILALAFQNEGIGAKTSSGYGRLELADRLT